MNDHDVRPQQGIDRHSCSEASLGRSVDSPFNIICRYPGNRSALVSGSSAAANEVSHHRQHDDLQRGSPATIRPRGRFPLSSASRLPERRKRVTPHALRFCSMPAPITFVRLAIGCRSAGRLFERGCAQRGSRGGRLRLHEICDRTCPPTNHPSLMLAEHNRRPVARSRWLRLTCCRCNGFNFWPFGILIERDFYGSPCSLCGALSKRARRAHRIAGSVEVGRTLHLSASASPMTMPSGPRM